MDPPSPIRRDLAQEEVLENIIHSAPEIEPPKSPSSFLNLSGGDGMEVDSDYPLQGKVRTEIEDGSDYGEDGSSDGEDGSSGSDGEAGGQLTKSGEVYRCNL